MERRSLPDSQFSAVVVRLHHSHTEACEGTGPGGLGLY